MIEIQNETQQLNPSDLDMLNKAVLLALEKSGEPEVDITLRLTGDEEMRELNKNFRGIAKTTDVLSFNQDFVDPETQRLYLGDIIISVERAAHQAPENGHTLTEECAFLAIHGTLHLLGYDHSEPDQKKTMWRLQDEIYQSSMNQQKE